MLEPGNPAPELTLPDQDGREVSLAELRGRTVVLYFYPRADTPGCTKQACSVRDREADYEAAGAVVLGVSPDPIEKVKRFHEKHGLNFTLLADEDHSVAERYGVWTEKTMGGNTFWSADRTTFVIGPDGKIADVLRRVKPKEHDDRVLAVLAAAR